MLASQIPAKFPIPFASGALPANIRPIPTPSQIPIQGGAASLTDGFPPTTFIQVAAGGIPPFGQDFNGLLNQITKWNQWQAMGGPITYDGGFSASIGGYAFGSQVLSDSGHVVYVSTVNGNLNNPNTNPVNWRIGWSIWSGSTWNALGSGNVQTVNLSPAVASMSQIVGIPLWIVSVGTNSGASTLNVGQGAFPILTTGTNPLSAGMLAGSVPYGVIFNGSSFILLGSNAVFTDPSTAGITVVATPTNPFGANIQLLGNGSTTPNKYIRAFNGKLSFVNSAYSSEIAFLDDTGNFNAGGNLTSGANVIAGGFLRATRGSTNSGDPNAATVLADFSSLAASATNGWAIIPSFGLTATNNFILQWGAVSVPANDTITTFNLPRAFPNNFAAIVISYGANIPPQASAPGVIGADPANLSQFFATNTSTGGVSNGCHYIAIGW